MEFASLIFELSLQLYAFTINKQCYKVSFIPKKPFFSHAIEISYQERRTVKKKRVKTNCSKTWRVLETHSSFGLWKLYVRGSPSIVTLSTTSLLDIRIWALWLKKYLQQSGVGVILFSSANVEEYRASKVWQTLDQWRRFWGVLKPFFTSGPPQIIKTLKYTLPQYVGRILLDPTEPHLVVFTVHIDLK